MENQEGKIHIGDKIKALFSNKRFIMVIAICLIVLTAALALAFLLPGQDQSVSDEDAEETRTPAPTEGTEGDEDILCAIEKPFELVPVNGDDNGVGTGSGYHIILKDKAYTAEALSERMVITPETEFTVEKKAENDFYLTPKTALKPNTLYSFAFSDPDGGISYSWAFQTRKDFFITATLPRDQATYVPVNTGIEITFSQKDIDSPEAFFDISPKVPGRFEIHKNVLAFVPEMPLANDTIYTVTVRKGLSQKNSGLALAEDTVFSFQTEPVKVSTGNGYSCSDFGFFRSQYNFYSHEIPMISVETDMDKDTPYEFSLYRYSSAEEFGEDIRLPDDRPYWCARYAKPIDIEGKEQVLSLTATLVSENDGENDYYYRVRYLLLPEPLPEGHYVAVMKAEGLERRAYIQINDMSVYVGTAVNKTISLVYDSKTSLPVEGAEIRFEDFSLKTDQEGLAVSEDVLFKTEDYESKSYAIYREGHPAYFATLAKSYNDYGSYYDSSYYYDGYYDEDYYYEGYSSFNTGDIADTYWGYLFTDRDMYLPSDTIRIWGMIAGKDGAVPPGKVTVTLVDNSKDYAQIARSEAALTGTHTFKSGLSFENLNEGYYRLQVESGGELLLSRYIHIDKYTKPIYVVNTNVSKKNVLYGENLTYGLEAGFFEGTPVSGMKFSYNISDLDISNRSGELKTDSDGKASLDLTAKLETQSWYPQSVEVSVTNTESEESNVYAWETFTVFPRDLMIEVESDVKEDLTSTVSFKTSKIDISKLGIKDWYARADYRGAPADVAMTVDLYEKYYTATQTGTVYDFVNKVSIPTYDYESHENLVTSYPISSVNGEAVLQFTQEENKGYYIKIRCKDGNGRPIEQTEWIYDAHYPSYSSGSRLQRDFYDLDIVNDDVFMDFNGQTAQANLLKNNKPCELGENTKVLYMVFRKGMLHYSLTNEASFAFELLKAYIPNLTVKAVCFDGKNMNTAVDWVYYKTDASELTLEVVPSADTYRPGDNAQLKVHVTDAQGNGRRAEVLFSVVDEAFFALDGQSVNLLYQIYSQHVSIGQTGEDIPHSDTLDDFSYFGGAEGGEGGDEASPVRSDFKDTALFETVMTDANGNGEISFKLPDNLTEWRVTYLAVTQDLCAGNGKVSIDTRLPYFVSTSLHDIYLTGDQPQLQVRSHGTAVKAGEKVDYTVEITKDGQPWKSYGVTSVTGERAIIPLDTLEEGSYRYTVSGKYGSYRDAVQYSFEVVPAYIEQTITDYQTLSEDTRFPEVKRPASVYFYNSKVRTYWSDLIDMACSFGRRIDHVIIRKQARDLLQQYYGSHWSYWGSQDALESYQLYNGGIALLPYDSDDPVLTAKIASLGDTSFNADAMKEYFRRTLTSDEATNTEKAAAYWGLACLREPILLELEEVLQNPDLLVADKLYIGLAYAYAGDLDRAVKVYQDAVKPYLKEDPLLGTYLDLDNSDAELPEQLEATSLCALLAQKVGAPQEDDLYKYVSTYSARDILTGMMKLNYIKSSLKNVKMELSFTYEIDGEKESVVLKGLDAYSMLLTADKLASIRFSDVKGDIAAATVYTMPLGKTVKTDPRVTLERSYLNEDDSKTTEFSASEIVKVRLNIHFDSKAPEGFYKLEDYLPASLKYLSANQIVSEKVDDQWKSWYPSEVSGQKVSFFVYHQLGGRDVTVEYYARVTGTGQCSADSAAIIHLDSNMLNYSDSVLIKTHE